MNKNNFYEKYPLVFPNGEPDFHCGSGWYQLLDCLFFVINKDLSELPVAERRFKILQIKEKFGSLTVYCEGTTEHIRDTISQAEEMSKQICETCGEYGKLRDSAHWIKVRCDECEAKHFTLRNTPLSPESRAALDEGIRSAKADIEAGKPPIYLGSFAQYADDDD